MQGKRIIIAHNWEETSFNTQSVKLAELLSEKNEVVFISQKRIENAPLQINGRLTVYQWPHKRPTKWKDFVFYWKLVSTFKPDIAIGYFASYNITTLVGKLKGIKHRISWYHTLTEQIRLDFKGSEFSYHSQRLRKKLMSYLNDQVIVSTVCSRNDIVNNYRTDKNKIHIIPNGIPEHSIRNTNQGELTFCFIGRYDNCKGVDILIEAFGIAKKEVPGIKLRMAGGKLNAVFQKMIDDNNLSDTIDNIGYIPYDQVLNFFCSSYAFIIPSRVDNLPTVIIEALSTATPVIGAIAGGIPEMMENEVAGFLVEKENPQVLASAIIKLAQSPELRNTMSVNARKTYEQKFTIPTYLKNVTVFLDSLN